MSLLEQAQTMTKKSSKKDYDEWCEKRIKILQQRILNHAKNGKNHVLIRDSKYCADRVYRHFKRMGFQIEECTKVWFDGSLYNIYGLPPGRRVWNGLSHLKYKTILISWRPQED